MHLKPLNYQIKKCEKELADCKWMPLTEYTNHSLVNDLDKFFAKKFIENRQNGLTIARSEMTLKMKDFVQHQATYAIMAEKAEYCSEK